MMPPADPLDLLKEALVTTYGKDYSIEEKSTKESFGGVASSKEKSRAKINALPSNIDASVKEEDLPALAMTLEKTQEMQKKIIIRETGNPNEYTVLIYGEKASAGAVRLGGNSNTFGELLVQLDPNDLSFKIKSKNVAAAQGNAQYVEKNGSIQKAAKNDIEQEAINSLVYQIAEGIKLNSLNGKRTQPLSGMVLNNYGSAHNFISNDNRKFIQTKERALAEIKKNWAEYYSQVEALLGNNKIATTNLAASFPKEGTPQMGFINRALNGFGPISISVNKKTEIASIEQRITQAQNYLKNNNPSEHDKKIIEQCIKSLEAYKVQKEQTATAGLFSMFDLKSWVRFFAGIPEALGAAIWNQRTANAELHSAAIDMVLSAKINSLEIGGCQSAKDRYGAVRITAQAYKAYIEKYNELPPAFGSKEFKDLSDEKKSYLKEQFAKAWLSGIGQEIAARNTEGATGLKNNTQILTKEHQLTIREEIVKQLKDKLGTKIDPALEKKLDDYQKTGKSYPAKEISAIAPKLNYFEAFDPKTSHKLSNLNKFDKEEVESFVRQVSSESTYKRVPNEDLNASFAAPQTTKPLDTSKQPSEKLTRGYSRVATEEDPKVENKSKIS
jgi:hypothetical protein